MDVTIFAAGSQGDVQPCVRLGNGLQRAGMQILLAAPQNYSSLAQGMGLPFHPLRGDVQQIMLGEAGQKYMESGGGNPIQSIFAMRKMLGPVALQMAEDTLEACRRADALITPTIFAALGATIAETCGIPLLLVEPTPVLPTGDFPAPGWPIQKDLGRWHNRLSGLVMLEVIWQWYRPFVNEFRKRLGLRPLNSADFRRALASAPLLGAYSPTVIPRPVDWPGNVHLTGYWFQETQSAWQPSAELEAFLSRGEAPVYVGFGSMAGRNPEYIAGVVVDALAQSGQRGILATGWGGMHVMNVPENVFVLDAAPHSSLFPRVSVVVHHGGAGTTAEGLRAGKPTVIVPFIVDQLFWGKRVRDLGAGPEPVMAKGLKSMTLANAIRQAESDLTMKQQAEAIGRAIRTEMGMATAVKIIRQSLGA